MPFRYYGVSHRGSLELVAIYSLLQHMAVNSDVLVQQGEGHVVADSPMYRPWGHIANLATI